MKTNLFKLLLPVGMGLVLFSITVLGVLSTTFTGCTKEDVCKTAQESAVSNCCKIQAGTGIQIFAVTVPDNCTCPSSTIYSTHDVTNKVLICTCKGC